MLALDPLHLELLLLLHGPSWLELVLSVLDLMNLGSLLFIKSASCLGLAPAALDFSQPDMLVSPHQSFTS